MVVNSVLFLGRGCGCSVNALSGLRCAVTSRAITVARVADIFGGFHHLDLRFKWRFMAMDDIISLTAETLLPSENRR